MPFYHFFGDFDEDFEREENEPAVPGAFEYENASVQFDRDKLSGLPALSLELLMAAGITEMRILYDGGSDEGFAHADDMWINGKPRSLDEIIDTLSNSTNVERIQTCALRAGNSYWHNAGEHYRKKEPSKVVSDALDELAHEIASQLLGSGYGTGELELYGAATLIFESGEITDDPQAERPLDRM